MTTQKIYQLPVEVTNWKFDGATEIAFNWEYDAGSSDLLNLYEKGKQQQWDTSTRLDWSQELFEGNPMGMADESIPIYGSPFWEKMTEKEKEWLRFNLQCHSICQFMHGEQGALIATAKIVQTVPSIQAKFYAATQVMDEARHVEAYARLLHEKVKLAYPITRTLALLLESTITDKRWDMTYLGMQVLIEGLALAAFQRIRDTSSNTLAAGVNAYVMQDEARHVAFGRLALREYYPHLSDAERDEREEFVVEACYQMRDRFNNAVASYTGTVHFSATDTRAQLPANAGLISGMGVFSATLITVGSQFRQRQRCRGWANQGIAKAGQRSARSSEQDASSLHRCGGHQRHSRHPATSASGLSVSNRARE
jgi:hypothetical protein